MRLRQHLAMSVKIPRLFYIPSVYCVDVLRDSTMYRTPAGYRQLVSQQISTRVGTRMCRHVALAAWSTIPWSPLRLERLLRCEDVVMRFHLLFGMCTHWEKDASKQQCPAEAQGLITRSGTLLQTTTSFHSLSQGLRTQTIAMRSPKPTSHLLSVRRSPACSRHWILNITNNKVEATIILYVVLFMYMQISTQWCILYSQNYMLTQNHSISGSLWIVVRSKTCKRSTLRENCKNKDAKAAGFEPARPKTYDI